jgi:4'-phosphopantetheinyl transferase
MLKVRQDKNKMSSYHKFRVPRSAFPNRNLFPVILPVPQEVNDFKPRDRVIFLSRHARRALKRSAEKSHVKLHETPKNEDGAPLPVGGIYWSITHKTHYVGGVVAPTAIGLDIERIRSCSPGLFQKTASEKEWSLAKKEESLTTFFRYWTSKEAVLKACGSGIKNLRHCRILRIRDANHLEINYEEKDWLIEHFFFDGHIASMVEDHFKLDWSIEE